MRVDDDDGGADDDGRGGRSLRDDWGGVEYCDCGNGEGGGGQEEAVLCGLFRQLL